MPKAESTSPADPKKRRVTPRRSAGSRLIEQQGLIIAAIEAGSTDHVAAQAVAGISPRAFRELRQRTEGRHPTRGATPELTEFFAEVDKAIARATMKQEIVVADTDPKHWLKYRARSKPGLEGWTEPVPEESETQDPIHVMSADELQQIVSTLLASGAVELPPCPDPSCTCSHHGVRGEEGEADEAP
jgi:hypothetical protein